MQKCSVFMFNAPTVERVSATQAERSLQFVFATETTRSTFLDRDAGIATGLRVDGTDRWPVQASRRGGYRRRNNGRSSDDKLIDAIAAIQCVPLTPSARRSIVFNLRETLKARLSPFQFVVQHSTNVNVVTCIGYLITATTSYHRLRRNVLSTVKSFSDREYDFKLERTSHWRCQRSNRYRRSSLSVFVDHWRCQRSNRYRRSSLSVFVDHWRCQRSNRYRRSSPSVFVEHWRCQRSNRYRRSSLSVFVDHWRCQRSNRYRRSSLSVFVDHWRYVWTIIKTQ